MEKKKFYRFTNVAEFAFVTAATDTFAGRVALAVARAIGYFTFIVFQATFTPFPAGIALATAVHIVASSAAQNWANTCKKRQQQV